MSVSDTDHPTPEEFRRNLNQFLGGGHGWYKVLHCIVTEGVYYVMSTCGCWLITDIVAFQLNPKLKRHERQYWQFAVNPDRSAVLKCHSGVRTVFKYEYEHVVFPDDHFEVHVFGQEVPEHGWRRVLTLPIED